MTLSFLKSDRLVRVRSAKKIRNSRVKWFGSFMYYAYNRQMLRFICTWLFVFICSIYLYLFVLGNLFVLELWAFYNFFSAQKREVLGVHRLALLEPAHSRTAFSCRCVGRPIRQTVNGWRQQFSSGHNNVPGTNFDSTLNKTLPYFSLWFRSLDFSVCHYWLNTF